VPADPLRLALLLAPLFAVGTAAGVLRGLALRAAPGSRRRRALSAAWVLVLLAAAPLWLVLAALLRLW
jgi:multisubunit Na+/H+ antiporter MnhB subunit